MEDSTIRKIKSYLRYEPTTGKIYRKDGVRPLGWNDAYGYTLVYVDKKYYTAHRLAFILMGHPLPTQVDHINGDKSDNRWCNLRPSTHATNQFNKGKQARNKSGYKGVTWDKNAKKWKSQIGIDGRVIFLGYFDCPKAAHESYKVGAKKYHGDFRRYE